MFLLIMDVSYIFKLKNLSFTFVTIYIPGDKSLPHVRRMLLIIPSIHQI